MENSYTSKNKTNKSNRSKIMILLNSNKLYKEDSDGFSAINSFGRYTSSSSESFKTG